MQKVLVLDADQRSALAIIRSLGRRGVHVVSGDVVSRTLGGSSRYASASVVYPDPATQPREFVERIVSIVRVLDIGIVIPATDLTTMLLVQDPILAKRTRLACPPAASYEALTDKQSLLALARGLGVRVPDTIVARNQIEIRDAAAIFGFPFVLKPARSRYVKGNTVVSTSVQIVNSAADLSRAEGEIPWLPDIPCLVQRFVPGYGAGVFTLYDSSRALAWFSHRRIREKPPSGGVSVLSESVAADPRMQIAAERLLSAVNWRGVAMVEFRVTSGGNPYLMEINGRFWGSLQLAVDCGVDFPWLTYQLLTNDEGVLPQTNYPLGQRLRWVVGDFDNLLIQLRSDQIDLAQRAAAVAQFTRSFVDPSIRQEILRMSDPRPAWHELRSWFGALRQ